MRKRRREEGIALLIAIFILLLIGVVAIALVVSSGTESALAGNYRSSTGVYYAALAGVEEARARLQPNDPNSFKNTWAAFPPPGTTVPIGTVGYVLNPSPTDNAGAMLTTYPDTEYDTEFGAGALAAAAAAGTVPTTTSVWNRAPLNGLAFPGPLYKWVRINAISEKSLNLDVDADGKADSTTPLYFDTANRVFSNNSGVGPQALELTALAVLPNGSQKLLQYLAAPSPVNLPPFPAALTLAGSTSSQVVHYSAPATTAGFSVNGIDQDSPNCSGVPSGAKYSAIGVLNAADVNPVINGGGGFTGIPATPASIRNNNYQGLAVSPDVDVVSSSFPPTLITPSGLDAVVQQIIQNADATIPTGSNATQTSFLSSLVSSGKMSASTPLTLVVNGDLDLTGWHNTGYGLLLVTGNLNYDPATTWDGIVMVVGQGTVTGSNGGTGQVNGAILVARTRDTSGALLSGPSLGNSSVNFNNGSSMGGNGILYSSCWIQKSQPNSGYKILSFHEISQ